MILSTGILSINRIEPSLNSIWSLYWRFTENPDTKALKLQMKLAIPLTRQDIKITSVTVSNNPHERIDAPVIIVIIVVRPHGFLLGTVALGDRSIVVIRRSASIGVTGTGAPAGAHRTARRRGRGRERHLRWHVARARVRRGLLQARSADDNWACACV